MSATVLHGEDLVLPFLLERASVRGRLVRLFRTADYVLSAHRYPEAVSRHLAELLVLGASFVGALKFEGVFSLQVRGNGPVRLMVVDVTNDGVMRGYASFDRERVEKLAKANAATLFGGGVLVLTVDQRAVGGDLQQGIVRLDGESLSEALLTYFRQSEQIPTAVRTASGRDPLTGRWRAAGILLQAMPGEGARDPAEREEHWRRVVMLLDTVTEEELLDEHLPPQDLLFRLFHEEGVRVFDPWRIEPGCSCSEERARDMLLQFPVEEIEGMRRDDGSIEVTCQFCSRSYVFDREAVERIVGERRRREEARG